MSDLSAIQKAVEDGNTALAQFKEAKNAEVEALRRQMEDLEAKSRRPGFKAIGADAVDAAATSDLKCLRTPDEIKSHYGSKAKEAGEEEVNLAEFLRGVSSMKTTPATHKALSVGTSSAGGYTVPNLLQSSILQALVPASSLLSAGAGLIPLEAGTTTTFAAVNSIPTAAWRAEAGTIAESDPTFRAVVATPRSLSFMFKISRELLADGKDVEAALRLAMAQSFAKELDRAGLRGSGTAPEPKGILNTAGIQAVGNGTNGAVIAGYANLFSAVQAILSVDAPMPTAAIMHPRSLVKLGALLDTTNQPVAVPPMLQPMKLLATSQIPINLTVGASTDCSEIYCGDFTRMGFAMRENVSIQLADQLFAASGQVAFIGHVRADVVLMYPSAFSVITGVR
jgi:HK97 family phage major capsid protein